jgi:hypothetical protein
MAVLRIVADEVRERGVCDRSLAEIAARAGVCRTLAHSTLRLAARFGLVSIEERRRPGRQRNLTNVIRVISREWRAWLAKGAQAKGAFRKMSPRLNVNPEPATEALGPYRKGHSRKSKTVGPQPTLITLSQTSPQTVSGGPLSRILDRIRECGPEERTVATSLLISLKNPAR